MFSNTLFNALSHLVQEVLCRITIILEVFQNIFSGAKIISLLCHKAIYM